MTCFSSCSIEYWLSSRTSSTSMALRQSFIVDFARRLERQGVDVTYCQCARVQTKAPRNVTSQLVRRHLRTRRAPQDDLLSSIHDGYGPVRTCGGLDLVEVDAKPIDLGDPIGTSGDTKKAIFVDGPKVTGAQLAVKFVTERQVLVLRRIAQHNVRAVVDQFTFHIRLGELRGTELNAQAPCGDRYADRVGFVGQRF